MGDIRDVLAWFPNLRYKWDKRYSRAWVSRLGTGDEVIAEGVGELEA